MTPRAKALVETNEPKGYVIELKDGKATFKLYHQTYDIIACKVT